MTAQLPDPDGISKTIQKSRKQSFADCDDCSQFEKHFSMAVAGRKEYEKDKRRKWDAGELVVSVDLQKVIMLPRLPGKTFIFCKRIVVFNETFAPVGGGSKKRKPIGVLWHEATSGRTATEVASTFLQFIRYHRDIKIFVLWADNCSAQNKNWWLYTMFVNEVNCEHSAAECIVVKYFEVGHTFMSADSFHHLVEQGMRKKKNVEDFQDFCDIVDKSGQALVMKYDDFYLVPRGVSQGKYASGKPLMDDIQVCKFEKGSQNMFWKTRYDQKDYMEAVFLQKKVAKALGNDYAKIGVPRGVYPPKKENIVNVLCPFLNANRRKFWEDLPVNEKSVDLVAERDPAETEDV